MHKAILGPLRPGTRTSVASAGRKTVGLRFLRPIRMCILVFSGLNFFIFSFRFLPLRVADFMPQVHTLLSTFSPCNTSLATSLTVSISKELLLNAYTRTLNRYAVFVMKELHK